MKCTAKNGAGEPCGKWAVKGATVCASHGGRAPQVKAAAARRVEEQAAQAAVVTLGLPVDISPTEALLEEVRWTAGHVQWLRGKVQELEERPEVTIEDADGNPVDVGGQHSLVWGVTREKSGGDDRGTTQEAAPNVWYVLYERERKHLVQVAAAALRAGVEERRVRLAESQGELVATVIKRILAALNLTPEQAAQVPEIVPRELRMIAGGAA